MDGIIVVEECVSNAHRMDVLPESVVASGRSSSTAKFVVKKNMKTSDLPQVWNLRDKHRVSIPRGAVYCGRGSPYGNPFIAGTHGSREHVIKRFVEEALPELDVTALRGKHLVCWCAPLHCHCDHILIKANRSTRVHPDIRELHDSLGNAPELLSDRDRYVIEEGLWYRSNVDMECKQCQHPYWSHSPVIGALSLIRLCNGDLVHL